jgi:CRISPR system Cascade subunit CasE
VDPGSLRVTKRGFQREATGSGQAVSLLTVQFDGLLSVMDETLFKETLRDGVGSGKGLGCGLLSVALPS